MITIVIPFFNAEKHLSSAIESILNQTYNAWKLILIDDGSTDDSLSIAKKYESDPRVSIITDGTRKNMSVRLNTVVSVISTKYTARMDADDIMHPMRIQRQIEVLESNPQIDVLGTNSYVIDENNKVTGIRMSFKNKPYLIKVKNFIHPTIVAKTIWFRLNPYEGKHWRLDDTLLWFKTYRSNNFMIITEPLLFYRENSSGYFRKYANGVPSLPEVALKNNFRFEVLSFCFRYLVSFFIFTFFHYFSNEKILLRFRNEKKINGGNLFDYM
jgi:glycosyltransferase involved in cell wall biosynthesis